MTRFLSAAAALVASAAALTAAAGPAHAQASRTAFYVATPEAASADARPAVMTRATGWVQRDGRFLAARAPERPELLCDLLARDVGRLSGFSAGGRSFDAGDLGRCNRRAKAAPGTAVAAR